MSEWRERATEDGSWTLWNETLGEGCHSLSGAWSQAVERYARGCRLAERAAAGARRLRLLDVGTGLGLNLAAALEALAPSGATLEALTLEQEPEAIARGLALYERAELAHGPWARGHALVRAALRAALDRPGESVPLGDGGRLELRLGDARVTLLYPHAHETSLEFDAVFLDPFSPRRASELWEEPFLAEIARRMARGAWLSTYSAAFRVRLALARASLRVGRGARVGVKGEGTLASPDQEPPPLPPRIARRLARRCAPGASFSPSATGFLPVRLPVRGPGFD